MRLFRVVAAIKHQDREYHTRQEIPVFYLEGDYLGIQTPAGAQAFSRRMLAEVAQTDPQNVDCWAEEV